MTKVYCLYCKVPSELVGAVEKRTSNGRLRMEGVCKTCKKRISSFVSSSQPKQPKNS